MASCRPGDVIRYRSYQTNQFLCLNLHKISSTSQLDYTYLGNY
ncbi:hypothetical protein FDUTEX481_06062 [Tolypothrix sp. PCC 7601]|nr:hypothetical protein FDUTEX481_06062 [Tolypothrix sp. PCC 7601]